MKYLIIIIIIFTSCQHKEEKVFDDFIFSSAGLHYDYSMKFSNNDTVYFQKRFPEPIENYYSLIEKNDRIQLDRFINKLDFTKYDTIYAQENLMDGGSLLFNITKQKENNWLFIYGHKAPKEILTFATWLNGFKEKQKLNRSLKDIDFGNLRYILPPPPPPLRDTVIYK